MTCLSLIQTRCARFPLGRARPANVHYIQLFTRRASGLLVVEPRGFEALTLRRAKAACQLVRRQRPVAHGGGVQPVTKP